MKSKTVAIIPARKGSSRLKNKNVVPLLGQPLIEWTIRAAQQSNAFDLILITSDDERALEIADSHSLEKLERPASLSHDTATTIDVLVHAIDHLSSVHYWPDRIMLLQPTSPLRSSEDIAGSVELFEKQDADSVISITPCEHPPIWTGTLPDNKSMENFLPDPARGLRSQDLGEHFRLNGAIYLAHTHSLIKNRGFFMKNSFGYVMPQERSVDIDTALDLALCETILRESQKTLSSAPQRGY